MATKKFSQVPTANERFFGVPTISSFDLVTSAPMQLAENVRFAFLSPRENPTHNFLIGAKSDYAWDSDSGGILVDGDSYSNNYVPACAQFIAPYDCYLKNIIGYVLSSIGGEGCSTNILHIGAWRKSVDIGGNSDTPIYLLFTQAFTFTSSPSEVHQIIGGNTLTQESLHINEGEGVIITMRIEAEGGEPCGADYYGDIQMVFESTENQATQGNFQLDTNMNEMGGTIRKTKSKRDVRYNNEGSQGTREV